MNNIDRNQIENSLWTKEAIVLIMADLQWKANELETRLRSPYPLPFFYQVQPPEPQPSEIQPNPNP